MSDTNHLPAVRDHKLPTIAELYKDKEMVIKQSELNVLTNQQPNKAWIRDHPVAKREIILSDGGKQEVPVQHIPIERLQWLMRTIFGKYTVHVIDFRQIANSVAVQVRLFYTNPITGEQEYVDGLGAVPLQTKKGSSAADFNNVKSNAVQIGLPAAKTFAEKDAISSLGKLFGSDLNRHEESTYHSQREAFEMIEISNLQRELGRLIGSCKDEKLVDRIVNETTEKEENKSITKEDYERWIKQLKRKPRTTAKKTTSSRSK